MSCSRAWTGVLVSAVRVVSTTELVGVHAKGKGKEGLDLSLSAVRDVAGGGGEEEGTVGNGEDGGRPFISLKNRKRNFLFVGLLSVWSD